MIRRIRSWRWKRYSLRWRKVVRAQAAAWRPCDPPVKAKDW